MTYDLDGGIRGVLASVIDSFEPVAIEEINMYLVAGEPGLALECICAVLLKRRKPIPVATYVNIADLGERMNMEPSCWQEIDVL